MNYTETRDCNPAKRNSYSPFTPAADQTEVCNATLNPRSMKTTFQQVLAITGIIFFGILFLFAVSCTPVKYRTKKHPVSYDKTSVLKIGKKKPCGC